LFLVIPFGHLFLVVAAATGDFSTGDGDFATGDGDFAALGAFGAGFTTHSPCLFRIIPFGHLFFFSVSIYIIHGDFFLSYPQLEGIRGTVKQYKEYTINFNKLNSRILCLTNLYKSNML
jgi:hypothetical protein